TSLCIEDDAQACVDLSNDPMHCGSCTRACELLVNTHPTCVEGVCGFVCEEGWGDCNNNRADGCEQSLDSQEHCGACGNDCQGRICFDGCLPRKVLAAGAVSAAVIRPDGKIFAWGRIGTGGPHWEEVVDLGPVVSIDIVRGTDDKGLVALRADGTVTTWNFVSPPAGLDQVIAIKSNSYWAHAVRRDGTVVAWSSGSSGTVVANLTDAVGVVGVAVGLYHGVALRRDGTVFAW